MAKKKKTTPRKKRQRKSGFQCLRCGVDLPLDKPYPPSPCVPPKTRPKMPTELETQEREVLSALFDASQFLINAAKAAGQLDDAVSALKFERMSKAATTAREAALKKIVRKRKLTKVRSLHMTKLVDRKLRRRAKLKAEIAELLAEYDSEK